MKLLFALVAIFSSLTATEENLRKLVQRYKDCETNLDMDGTMDTTANEENLRKLVQRHKDCETNLDIDGTMDTLVDHPIYEFYPSRLKLEGKENVRNFYRDHFSTFFPRITASKLIHEWWEPDAVCMEYDLWLKDKDKPYRILVVVSAEGSLLKGERFYAEDELVRLMTGDSYNRLTSMP